MTEGFSSVDLVLRGHPPDPLRADHHRRGNLRLFRSRRRCTCAHYHADLWWGLILLAIGVFYCYHFAPGKIKSQKDYRE